MGKKVRKTTESDIQLGTIVDIYTEYKNVTNKGTSEFIIFDIQLRDGSVLRQTYLYSLDRYSELYPILEVFFGEVHDEIDIDLLVGSEWYFELQPISSNNFTIRRVFTREESLEFQDTLHGLVMEVCGNWYSIQNPLKNMLPI